MPIAFSGGNVYLKQTKLGCFLHPSFLIQLLELVVCHVQLFLLTRLTPNQTQTAPQAP